MHRISDCPHKSLKLRYNIALHLRLCVQHVSGCHFRGTIQRFHYAEAERGLKRHLTCFATFQSITEVQKLCSGGQDEYSAQHSTPRPKERRLSPVLRIQTCKAKSTLAIQGNTVAERCVLALPSTCRCCCCCCGHSNDVLPSAAVSQSQSVPSESAQHELPAVGDSHLLLLYRGRKDLAPHKALPVPAKPRRPRPQTLVHHKPCQHSRQLHLDLPYVRKRREQPALAQLLWRCHGCQRLCCFEEHGVRQVAAASQDRGMADCWEDVGIVGLGRKHLSRWWIRGTGQHTGGTAVTRADVKGGP